jgi:hypothetical protein
VKVQNTQITPSFRSKAKDIFPLSYIGVDSPTNWLLNERDDLGEARSYLLEASYAFKNIEGNEKEVILLQNI